MFQIVSGVALHNPVLFIFILIRSIFCPKVWGKQFFRPTLSKKHTHATRRTRPTRRYYSLCLVSALPREKPSL